MDKCYHLTNYKGQTRRAWRRLPNKNLAKQNTWVFRCKLCGCLMAKQLVPDQREFGMGWKTKTYILKNEYDKNLPSNFA